MNACCGYIPHHPRLDAIAAPSRLVKDANRNKHVIFRLTRIRQCDTIAVAMRKGFRRFMTDIHCLLRFANLDTGAAYAPLVRSVGKAGILDDWRTQCVSEISLTRGVGARCEVKKVGWVGAGGKRPQMKRVQEGRTRDNGCALAMAPI